MIFIAAQYLYSGNGILKKNQILKFDSKGIFLELGDFKEEIHSTVFYNGIIFPVVAKREDIPSIFGKMQKLAKSNADITITELLDSFAFIIQLKAGESCDLWCIENPDFINMRIQESTVIKKVSI